MRDTILPQDSLKLVWYYKQADIDAGVAAVQCQFFIARIAYLSELAIDSDWHSQQEEIVVVGCMGGKSELAWKNTHCYKDKNTLHELSYIYLEELKKIY